MNMIQEVFAVTMAANAVDNLIKGFNQQEALLIMFSEQLMF